MKVVLGRTWSLVSVSLYPPLPSSALCVCLFVTCSPVHKELGSWSHTGLDLTLSERFPPL